MKTIKHVNVYDLCWRFLREYWILTDDPDGHIRIVNKTYHKTIN